MYRPDQSMVHYRHSDGLVTVGFPKFSAPVDSQFLNLDCVGNLSEYLLIFAFESMVLTNKNCYCALRLVVMNQLT